MEELKITHVPYFKSGSNNSEVVDTVDRQKLMQEFKNAMLAKANDDSGKQ